MNICALKCAYIVCTCDDSSVLSATRNVYWKVILQPELTRHIVSKTALSKCEDSSCF